MPAVVADPVGPDGGIAVGAPRQGEARVAEMRATESLLHLRGSFLGNGHGISLPGVVVLVVFRWVSS